MKLYELLHMQFDENEAGKMLAIRCFCIYTGCVFFYLLHEYQKPNSTSIMRTFSGRHKVKGLFEG